MLEQLDIKNIEKRFFIDYLFLQEVLKSFETTSAKCLTDLREGISTNSPKTVEKAAHKLKGSILNFIENSLVRKLERMEIDARVYSVIHAQQEDIDEIEKETLQLIHNLNVLTEKWSPHAN